ncbi:MAG TPA: hypothetical protein VHX88_21855 [Solirubrobacteraceae bacterium]|jgi:hypothetical protein|nr:hypothetical protein [Solirubrobacteraceae bacterium]
MANAPGPGILESGRRRTIAIVAAAVLVWIVAWLVLHRSPYRSDPPVLPTPTLSTPGTSTPAAAAPPGAPRGMTPAQLARVPARVGHRVYWAGPMAPDTNEVTVNHGNVYVRYLPPGVAVGSPRTSFVTIGTYPQPGALAKLNAGRTQATFLRPLPGGGIAITTPAHPASVYLAYPRVPLSIEVYAATPRQAQALALSGRVRAV